MSLRIRSPLLVLCLSVAAPAQAQTGVGASVGGTVEAATEAATGATTDGTAPVLRIRAAQMIEICAALPAR